MLYKPLLKAAVLCRREVEKMKDAVNAAASGDGLPTRRIAGDAGREYILQTEDDTKAKAALDAGLLHMQSCAKLHQAASSQRSVACKYIRSFTCISCRRDKLEPNVFQGSPGDCAADC